MNKKIVVQLSLLIVTLIAVGHLIQYRVDNMLNETLEQRIAQQAADMSIVAEERFAQELSELHFAAKYLAEHPDGDTTANVISSLDKNVEGVSVGLIQLNGQAIIGNSLSKSSFLRLSIIPRGIDVVDYCSGRGLLFAVPVIYNGRVRGVVYRLYSENLLSDLFGLTEYSSDSRLLIQERDGKIIVPYKNYGEKDKNFFTDPSIVEAFKHMRSILISHRSAAIYYEGSLGKYFLFASDLPRTNCTMIGYVVWSAVAGDISRTNNVIFTLMTLMLLLFLIASIYLFLINEKAKQSDEFKREKQAADQANQAKSAFLANMSHEIRTPINAVIGMNEMILRESKENDTIKYAQNVAAASESLLSIINDILDFSKIESGKMELVEDKYKLDEVIKNLINMIKSRAEKKNLELIVNVNEKIPNELLGDSVRIRQVVVNFLTNAVKYTKVGSVTFSVDFELRDATTILLEFSVKDTGIGIRDEDKKNLFTEFQRLDSKKNKNIEGTGLGLAIAYKLVKMMNGWINVDSVYGEGSTFSVVFPQRVTGKSLVGNFEDKLRAMKKQEGYKVSFVAPNAKILIVDDNEMNLLVVTSLLKNTKIQIDTASDGMLALKKLKDNCYDIIFLDQMMPNIDGIQTLKLAKNMEDNKSKDAPTIALTANAISGAREMFLREGFTDYLSKPIDATALEKILINYLPPDKVNSSDAPAAEVAKKNSSDAPAEVIYNHLNVEVGLQYSSDMEDLYKEFLTMFCNLKDEKQKRLQETFSAEDWKNYTILVHALKSTSLSIGGEKCSDAAKKLELAGKMIIGEGASKDDKQQGKEYIKAHHAEAMELYNKLTEEGRRYLAQGNIS